MTSPPRSTRTQPPLSDATMPPPPLHHIPLGHIPFHAGSHLQSLLQRAHLASKTHSTNNGISVLAPTLLTAEFEPVYTLGRREAGLPPPPQLSAGGHATVARTLRGGQTTYHGPGQVTAYLVTDLRAHGIGPRCYIRRLEEAVIATVARYGVLGVTTEDPGVWVSGSRRKVCALGVQMRRNVTSFGLGLNVHWDPLSWWFERIVPCGLQGKTATAISEERPAAAGGSLECAQVATELAGVLASRLGRDVVETDVETSGVITGSEWRRVVEREWEVVRRRVAGAEETLEEVKRREERERRERRESIPPAEAPS
jgi:lipoate-protein ligase B